MILQLLFLAVILFVAFYTGRFIFWLLFLKDAPAYEEQDHYLINYPQNQEYKSL